MAIEAGVDVLMFANNVPGYENVTVKDLHQLIRSMVDEGEISAERIKTSYERIMKLKRKIGIAREGYVEKLAERLK